MNRNTLLILCAGFCLIGFLQAASLHATAGNKNIVLQKLADEGVEVKVRTARQTYAEEDLAEGSDEDDEEADVEQQHQADIRRQEAYEQSVNDSQEGSDEDGEDNFEEHDDDDDFGRRFRRDVSESIINNEIKEPLKPSKDSENKDKQPAVSTSSTNASTLSNTVSPNTSVLVLIRDTIKKVTEFPNSQQVATSAQQYFQLFEYFLQQTIEQVIGDDDDEEEIVATTINPETEKETITEINVTDQPHDTTSESNDKQTSVEHEVPQPEKQSDDANEVKS